MTTEETMADKISKLLRKAESTDSPDEAQALFAKAQELMVKYAIDELMLVTDKKAIKEAIVRMEYFFKGIYSGSLVQLAWAVGRANDCRLLQGSKNKGREAILIGFESDTRNARLLIQSLEIQALSAMKNWWDTNREQYAWAQASQQYQAKREFILAFASTIAMRLQEARREGVKQAEATQAERSGATAEVAKTTVALALRDKSKDVDDWMDKTYGTLRKGRTTHYKSGGMAAREAGRAAGYRADLNMGDKMGSGSPRKGLNG